jgi:predicted ester cyclase
MHIHQSNKQRIGPFRAALYDCNPASLKDQLNDVFASDCEVHLAFPFEDLDGPDALFERAYRPLLNAVPDLERRDFIVMAGEANGDDWVGCGGYYTGVFERPWLDIPPTQHALAMRFHEFFRLESGTVVEMQALWDIPQVMMQADAWPLAPSLGVEWVVPGPATQDGIQLGPSDQAQSEASMQLVLDMVDGLMKSSQGFESMGMERFWHPKMHWYGPAGIGTARRLSGFQHWHQFPFLRAMPDRKGSTAGGGSGASALFADGNYVAASGWPNMSMTLSGDGWLGIPPAGQEITMRSLDFWRVEDGLLRENWVLVDLLSVYDQLGVDVFARMREVTYARQLRA